jgi:DNA-binding transcriptional LysR family regulator
MFRAGFPPPENTRLVARPIWHFNRVTVAAPSYLRGHPAIREPQMLAEHEAIVQLAPSGPLQLWSFERGSDRRSLNVHGRLRLSAPAAIHAAAVAGVGVAWLPAWLVADALHAGALRQVLPDWISPITSAWAIYRREARRSAILNAVLASIVDRPS